MLELSSDFSVSFFLTVGLPSLETHVNLGTQGLKMKQKKDWKRSRNAGGAVLTFLAKSENDGGIRVSDSSELSISQS